MIFRITAVICILMGISTAFAFDQWQLRLDINGNVKLRDVESAGWKINTKPSVLSCLKTVTVDETECTITFTPEADGSVVLSLRSESGHDVIESPWVVVSGVSAQGTTIKNADFKALDRNGLLRGWKGKKENISSSLPGVQVNYDNAISQRITLQKDVPVTLRLRARIEQTSQMELPPWSNVVTDHVTNIQTLISSGRLEFRPTFENCGVYINRKPSEIGKPLKLKLSYRETGENNWREALDPVEIPLENSWRGSIMMLKENTSYEVKCDISGELSESFTGSFRTMNSQVKIAETIELSPKDFPGELVIAKSGSPDGYIRYTMKPGGVLKGNASGQAVIIAKNVSYIILENLMIDGNRTPGGIQILNSHHIQVKNCNIYNFGRVGVQRLDLDGQYYLDGKSIYHDPGIELRNSGNILVERCFIHNPAGTSNTWFYSHPAGPSALRVQNTSGVILRYNDLVGSDRGRFIDVIHAPVNSQITGGFMRDTDIYGNLFIFSNDDAIELEGGGMNTRFYLNRVEGTFTGVSTGVCRLGPIYQIRNLYTRPGDEEHRYGVPFKNSLGYQGYGAVYFINNTVVNQEPRIVWSAFHRQGPEEQYENAFKAFSRNNIVVSKKTFFTPSLFQWRVDFDYDMMEMRLSGDAAQEKAEYDRLKQEANAIYKAPEYVNAAAGDFRLALDSPGRGGAAKLPNIPCSNLGAFQDDGIDFLPYRPLPLLADRQEIYFQSAEAPLKQSFRVTVGGRDYNAPFKVHCNDDFFSVEPSEGIFKSGEEITFQVTLNPEKMPRSRRYNGAMILRTGLGFSLPITVYADYRGDRKRQEKALESALVIPVKLDRTNPKVEAEIEVPEDGVYFLLTNIDHAGLIKDIRVKIGNCDTGKQARLHGPEMRNGSFEYQPVNKGHLSAYYFKLKAGKQKLSLSVGDFENGTITKLLLTRSPGLFCW